jgi:hypothetical protein
VRWQASALLWCRRVQLVSTDLRGRCVHVLWQGESADLHRCYSFLAAASMPSPLCPIELVCNVCPTPTCLLAMHQYMCCKSEHQYLALSSGEDVAPCASGLLKSDGICKANPAESWQTLTRATCGIWLVDADFYGIDTNITEDGFVRDQAGQWYIWGDEGDEGRLSSIWLRMQLLNMTMPPNSRCRTLKMSTRLMQAVFGAKWPAARRRLRCCGGTLCVCDVVPGLQSCCTPVA